MKSSKFAPAIYLLLAAVVFAFNGCGGGGGGGASTVSGVAAAGSPLIGQVAMVDAKGVPATGSPMTIAANGSFAFNASGLTPPFILKANGNVGGTNVTMYSAALAPGTANINPMSNIVVAAAAGVNDPALVFTNPVANTPNMTATTFNKAVADMQTMMAPLLAAFNATGANPVTGSYAANHTGLDAVFDVVQMPINTSTGTMSVFDKTAGTSGTTIGEALMSQMATPTQAINPNQLPSTTVPTDLQKIGTMLNSMGSVLNKGSSLTTADLTPYFVADPAFGINGGMTAPQMMAFIQASIPELLAQGNITQMSNVSFNGNSPVGGYRISFAVHLSDGSMTMSDMTFSDEMVVAKNASNAWQFKGNGHHSLMFNNMLTQQWQTSTATQTEAGLNFDMMDAANVFKSAVATGPGLPSPGGVMFIKETANPTLFMMATANTTLPTMDSQFFAMSDATVGSIPDNAPYVFSFYSSLPPRNNPMEQRTMTFPKRCFTRAEATGTSGLFPTVTPTGNLATHTFSTMMGNMMGMMGGSGMLSMSFSYTTPTALQMASMSANFNISSSTFSNEASQTLPLNRTSMTMQMTGPTVAPTTGTGAITVNATDILGRNVGTAWMFQ
jgi:hypothetical protein